MNNLNVSYVNRWPQPSLFGDLSCKCADGLPARELAYGSRAVLKRGAFATTDTELKLMAAAIIGLSSK